MYTEQYQNIKKILVWLTLQLNTLFLKVKLEGSYLGGIIDSEDGYELRPVSGSNVFLILKQRRSNDEDKCCDSEVCQTTPSLRTSDYCSDINHYKNPFVSHKSIPRVMLCGHVPDFVLQIKNIFLTFREKNI